MDECAQMYLHYTGLWLGQHYSANCLARGYKTLIQITCRGQNKRMCIDLLSK